MSHASRIGLPASLTLALVAALSLVVAVPRPVSAEEAFLAAELTGAAEVDDTGTPNQGDPDGTGIASVRIDTDAGQICAQIDVEGIAAATAAHIHQAPAGENGPVVVTLATPDAGGHGEGCVDVDAALLEAMIANPANFYVNVHNEDYPNGAVRGQLAFGGECFISVSVDGGEPQETATVSPGQEVVVWGYFSPGADIEFTVSHDGEVVDTVTVPAAEGDYYAEIIIDPQPGDEGAWQVDVVDLRSGCESTLSLTVAASTGPTAVPTPAALPDTSTEPRSEPMAPAATLALLALALVVGSTATARIAVRGD